MSKKVKVMIVDDSALTRSILKEIISSDKRIEIVGVAFDPIMALERIPKLKPDVLTLDLVMPKMDGITFLRKLAKENPIPTIVISGNSPKDSSNAIQALESGAIDIIEKPDISSDEKYNEVKREICEAILGASLAKKGVAKSYRIKSLPKEKLKPTLLKLPSSHFYVIGASTGGPKLLKEMFAQVSGKARKGFVVVQHMPGAFTKSFAERLDETSDLEIVESRNGEPIENGKVIIVPGEYHGVVKKGDSGFFVELSSEAKVNLHRPSVDVLFESAADTARDAATGILLTGMGADGARGLKKLKEVGGKTVAQEEQSCAVFGMPKAAIELGAAMAQATPQEIVQMINEDGA